MREGIRGVPEILQRRYVVLRSLGSGSSGAVFACRDLELGSVTVAVKLFPLQTTQDKATRSRLQRELLSAFTVNHDNVVRFYEPIIDEGFFGYSMEYVEGSSLEDLLQEGYRFSAYEIARILSQLCAGLEAIHQADIVHRDIKPGNVLLTSHGVAKITDLGLAKDLSSPQQFGIPFAAERTSRSNVTQQGETPGTPDYISPEYVEHGTCDSRSDLFAVGVIGYELITGKCPFAEFTIPLMMQKKVEEDPPPPHYANSSCPLVLSAIVSKALARNPNERYQTAREMRRELQDILWALETEPSSYSTGAVTRGWGSISEVFFSVLIPSWVIALIVVAATAVAMGFPDPEPILDLFR